MSIFILPKVLWFTLLTLILITPLSIKADSVADCSVQYLQNNHMYAGIIETLAQMKLRLTTTRFDDAQKEAIARVKDRDRCGRINPTAVETYLSQKIAYRATRLLMIQQEEAAGPGVRPQTQSQTRTRPSTATVTPSPVVRPISAYCSSVISLPTVSDFNTLSYREKRNALTSNKLRRLWGVCRLYGRDIARGDKQLSHIIKYTETLMLRFNLTDCANVRDIQRKISLLIDDNANYFKSKMTASSSKKK